jgi:hypothetical protein
VDAIDLGWVETFPGHAPVGAGTVVAVLIRHLGFWSLNGARVVYRLRAASRPRAALARLGKPIVRALQARFRRDSLAAMTRVNAHDPAIADV